jgi:pyruvate kinase
MDVARLHLSHGAHADHARVYSMIRQASDESGRAVGILADLQGPKVRLGRFAAGPVQWSAGDEVRLTVAEVAGTHDRVSTTYAGLVADVGEGDRLLVNGGKVVLMVRKVEDADVVCEVVEGGLVSDHQGLSLPRMNASVPALSAKDVTDLEFALRLRVDLVALSFVRSPADIDQVHRMMDALPGGRLPVIAKLEKPQAVDNLEAIVVAFDGVMVSRGALGVELPWSRCRWCKSGLSRWPGRTPNRWLWPRRCLIP